MTEVNTNRIKYPNLFFVSCYDRDDYAVADAMDGYYVRDYEDVDYTDPAALLEEAKREYDSAWRDQDGVFTSYEEAEAAAGPGRHVAEVSLELLASQIAHLAFQVRHIDEDDSDILELEQLDCRDIIWRVRELVEEQGLR